MSLACGGAAWPELAWPELAWPELVEGVEGAEGVELLTIHH